MRNIFPKLFSKSPFNSLQGHMDHVTTCSKLVADICQKLDKLSKEELEARVLVLSKVEHEADVLKNDVRNSLPSFVFLPIERSHFLEILAIQDSIADSMEEIGLILTLKNLENYLEFKPIFIQYFDSALLVFQEARKIIKELDRLIQSSFGGHEAEHVADMVKDVASKEYESKKMKRTLLKKLYSVDNQFSISGFSQWKDLMDEVEEIALKSEALANRLRMTLEIKK